ncbi:DUF2911 domain-containing protein [Sediminicola arcticus]|jgi:hypothetical protein|uniref:DUF2911 domain-containing protein n=1 Tax=Sediminicola arcticus TaxID=1574308 RepID=A0ABV2SUR3_9FLAO
MKKLILLLLAVVATYSVQAQIETPAPSPAAKVWQTVGMTDVTLEYSRPSMRGRTIFGDLVPYDMLWRTGANARTLITFSTDVMVDGQALKAGTYAIFTKPGASTWEVFFYTDTQGGGTPAEWDETKIAAKTVVTVDAMPSPVETFTMTFDDLTSTSAVLGILWEKAYIGVKFDVPTDAMVMKAIEKTMAGPDAGDYYASAVYFYSEGKDIAKAKTWMDKAMAMTTKPAYWQLRQQSLIYAKAGDKKGAIEAAKKSLAGAEAAGNADYVKMNKDSLKEWGAK